MFCWLEDIVLLVCFLLQHVLLALKEPLEGIPQVEQEREAIRDLLRLGSSFARALCIRSCSVTANHLNAGMSYEPGLQCFRLPVWQEIHNAMALEINEDRGIRSSLADGSGKGNDVTIIPSP